MEPSKYEERARTIAGQIGIEVIAAYQGNECPERSVKDPFRTYSTCKDCGSIHGDKYRVTIKRCGVALDAQGSTDPDEIFEEYGPMPPSKAEQIAQATRKLQAFFTPADIEALSHVDE